MKKKLLALLLCAVLLVSALPLASADAGSYVALGDSITAGYRLAADEACFAQLVAEEQGLALQNLAESGLTTTGLLAQLETEETAAALAEAELVTVTIGGNDLMGALYTYLARVCGAESGTAMTAEQIAAALASGDPATMQTLLAAALRALPQFPASEEATAAFAAFGENLGQILAKLKVLAPQAKIVVATQYNPYGYNATGLAKTISDVFDTGLVTLNGAIAAACTQAGCTVADVYTAFQGAAENPCNASFANLDLDFHPNAYGHSLLAAAVNTALLPANPYTDITPADWYYEAAVELNAAGIMQGTGSGIFGAQTATSRATLVTLLYRLEGSPAVAGGAATFSDVVPGSWYADAVQWAAENKLVEGYPDGTFGVNTALTREQIATILFRYAQYKGYDVSVGEDTNILSYPDIAQASEYAMPALQWACGAGLLGDTGNGALAPRGSAVRGQIAVVLLRFLENVAA